MGDRHLDQLLWQRSLSTSSDALPASSNLLFCSTILLFHKHTAYDDWMDDTDDYARYLGIGTDVLNNSAIRLSHLFMVPKNCEKKRHLVVVLNEVGSV